MPFPNEHSARLHDPGEFKEKPGWAGEAGGQFRRTQGGRIGGLEVPKTISIIWGQLKSQSGEAAAPQALRFPVENWTADEARAWLKEHDIKFKTFEPAEESRESSRTLRLCFDLAPAGAPAPNVADGWRQVGLLGEWKGHPQGPFRLSREDIESILALFQRDYAAHGAELVVDYNHATLFGGESRASGWISRLEARDAGTTLWAWIRWTEPAREGLRRGEWRYLSPAVTFNARDRITGERIRARLESVGLTNTPFLTELPAAASVSAALAL